MKNIMIILFMLFGTESFAQTVMVDMSRAVIYNHKLMGRPAALFNEQDTTSIPSSCGVWYIQPSDSVWCFNGYNAPMVTDAPHLPWPASVTVDLRARYIIKRICLYIENYTGDSSTVMHHNTAIITSGIPYVWGDTLATFAKDGVTQYNRWKMVSIDSPDTSRYIHLEVNQYFGIIREMVIYGELIDTVVKPLPALVKKPTPFDRFGTNSTLGDGKGKDYQTFENVDYSVKFDRLRIFGAMRYYVDSSDNLRNNGQGLNILEAIYADTLYNNGVDYFYSMAGLTALSQVDPAKPSDGFLTDRKAIDYTLCAGSRQIGGIEVCDNVAADPDAYSHIAWIVKKLASEFGGRPKPMKILELGNEFDGKFLAAGMYLPDEMAAMCSAIYDGHENTVTYNGQSVGVRNCGNNILMSMPGLATMNPQYLETMSFWFEHNRIDRKFASDIINTHAYATSAGLQGMGMNGAGLPPESKIFGLEEKMRYIKTFRDSLAPHALVANTETGYDAFEETTGDASIYCQNTIYGNSFMNVPYIPGQTIEQTHGNFIARTMLIHTATELDFTCQFWLADRIVEGTGCGTFASSGLLALDTIIDYVPYYRRRVAYYYFRTIDKLLKGMDFVSDRTTVNGTDTIRVQKYHDPVKNKLLYVLWIPTAKNALIPDYYFEMDDAGITSTIELSASSETGIVTGTDSLRKIILDLSEKPVFVYMDSIFPNLPPIANAGVDTISSEYNASLAGTGTDPDGSITGYHWKMISGPAAGIISNITSASTMASGLQLGTYGFELVVTDNKGASAKDTVEVRVISNQSPYANAGSDIAITIPASTAYLAGFGIDPDGTIEGYRWTKISGPGGGNIADPGLANVYVTGLVQGTYLFEVTVTDNLGATGTDFMQLTVNAVPANNQGPYANAGSDVSITLPVNSASLTGFGIDPDGAIAGYRWTKISGPAAGTLVDPLSANATATGLVQGNYLFEVEVTDNYGATGTDVMQVTVNPALPYNQSPYANAGSDVHIIMPANEAALTGFGIDPDGTVVAYLWTKISGPASGSIVNQISANATAVGLTQGLYVFELMITDNNGASGTDVMQVIVNSVAPNQGPYANAGSDVQISLPLDSAALSGYAIDPDGTIVQYHWTRIAGPAAGIITNPDSAMATVTGLAEGVYRFEIEVTDNNGATGTDFMELTVTDDRNLKINYFVNAERVSERVVGSDESSLLFNPVKENLVVVINTERINRKSVLIVSDSKGATVAHQKIFVKNKIQIENIDMRTHASGMYFLSIFNEGERPVLFKFVKL